MAEYLKTKNCLPQAVVSFKGTQTKTVIILDRSYRTESHSGTLSGGTHFIRNNKSDNKKWGSYHEWYSAKTGGLYKAGCIHTGHTQNNSAV
jgi:hypothetical protein